MIAIGRNRIAAVACAAIAALLFALTYGFEQMPESITRGMGAEVFPRLVLGVIMVLSLLLALAPEGRGEGPPPVTPRVLATAAGLALFMGVLEITGMLPAMFLFLLGIGWLWGERRPLLLALVAGVVTVAIWAVFAKGFGVPLPAGMLGALLGYR